MITVTPTAVHIGGISIHFYALCIVTGMVLAILLASMREERMGLKKETAVDLALWCIPAALAGARIYYVLFSIEEYKSGPWWRIFAIWEGGLAIYGGILAAVIMGFLFAKRRQLSFPVLADLAAPCMALGQAIGRWGNFINQECHGGPVENAALRFFPAAVNIGNNWYYATFFYESVWCLMIVAVLLILEKRHCFRRKGDEFLCYILLYALERAVVEGLRTDSLYWGSLRVSQVLSLAGALVICLYWAIRERHFSLAPILLIGSIIAARTGSDLWQALGCVAALIATAADYMIIRKKPEEQSQ